MRTDSTRRMTSLAVALALAMGGIRIAAQTADLYNNTNTQAVGNMPSGRSAFTLRAPARVTQIETYHWNNGKGARPGTIQLQSSVNGQNYGTFAAHGTAGQNGAQNVNWIADVNVTLPAGSYFVFDSDQATWSQNAGSNFRGFVIVRGTYLGKLPTGLSIPSTTGGGAGGAGGSKVGGPVILPQPPQTSYQWCAAATNATVKMAQPCFGPAGTVLTFQVQSQLAMPLTSVVFGHGSISAGPLQAPAGAMVVVPLVLGKGNGVAPGSEYRATVPPTLCARGKNNNTAWDVYLGPGLTRDVSMFTIQSC